MSKHTKGPWFVHDCKLGIVEISNPHGNAPAVRVIVSNADECQAMRDAQLIAAAPDLLEACETALQNLICLYSSDHLVVRRLSKALAKATGQKEGE